MIRAPEYIRTIQPYVPGKPVEELERELGISESIKLASNESPLGASPHALRAIRQGIHDVHRYPDGTCHYLRAALSEKLGLVPDELLFGNGSNELIELAVRTYLRPGDEAIVASPSFVVYSMIVQAAGGKTITVPLKECGYDLDSMASRITKKTRMIFIANPNNPTGTITTGKEMEAFMEEIPDDVLVVLDEAYSEYVTSPHYADSMKYFRANRDILVLRTFSKIYGLAGLRIGYGIAKTSIISDMNRVRQPFNINALAQRAALAALKDEDHLQRAKRLNERGKKYLYRAFKELDIHYIPTEANFIYVILDSDSAPRFYNELLKEGIIVRPMGLRELRITIGLPKENKRFIEALGKTIKNEK